MNSKLIFHTYTNTEAPRIAIIGLHGWTGDEHVFEPIAKLLNIRDSKWFFPRAPYNSDSGKGYTWFSGSDNQGWELEKTWKGMDQLMMDVEANGFLRKNIFLIGFSQGATLAMEFALRLPYAIGGIVPISGFIKFMDILEKEATIPSKKTPVLLLHGNKDTVIPHRQSEKAYRFIKGRGHKVHLEIYNGPHKISTKTVPHIQNFISNPLHFFS